MPEVAVQRTETVPCPICGEGATRTLFEGDGFAMGKCRTCNLVRQNPRLTAAYMREVEYDGAVQELDRFVGRKKKYDGLEFWENKPLAAYHLGVDAIEAARDADAGPRGPWIDVGCSTGAQLVAARERGWPVIGVEIGSGQVQLCREHHGMQAFLGTLTEAAYPDGHAEVVSYRHVLEHIHDLDAELTEVQRVVRPGGLLLIEVPHYGGVKYRIDAVRAALKLMKRERTLHNVPEHLYYFTRSQLIQLLERYGFDTVSVRTYGRYRPRRSFLRRGYERLRDRLCVGNKIRVVARRRPA